MAEKSNLTLEERFTQLEKANNSPETPKPKIQMVAHHLRERKHFTKHYLPKLVSFGPIHHGKKNLQLGEQYKLKWASTYINSYEGQTPRTLHQKIVDDIENLKGLFDTCLFTDCGTEENIRWMLFVDGCALLQILETAKLEKPENMNIKVDQLVLVMQDVLLLENQLPYSLLKLLWRDTERKLIDTMKNFLRCHHWATREEDKVHIETEFKSPTHLLDLQRTIILHDPKNHTVAQVEKDPNPHITLPVYLVNQTRDQVEGETRDPNKKNEGETRDANISICCGISMACNKENEGEMVTYRNIQELKMAGIGLKASHSRRPRVISFDSGWFCAKLTLPQIVVDDTTAATMLNLIAYEVCPDFENDHGICSFVAFLDSLIDHPDDVKALRSEGILLNSLGSDEEVANLFNIIGADLVPDMGKYSHVRAQIERHYKNIWRTWLMLGYHTYFSNPWLIIALIAALLGLVLTFIQTWFAVHPAK